MDHRLQRKQRLIDGGAIELKHVNNFSELTLSDLFLCADDFLLQLSTKKDSESKAPDELLFTLFTISSIARSHFEIPPDSESLQTNILPYITIQNGSPDDPAILVITSDNGQLSCQKLTLLECIELRKAELINIFGEAGAEKEIRNFENALIELCLMTGAYDEENGPEVINENILRITEQLLCHDVGRLIERKIYDYLSQIGFLPEGKIYILPEKNTAGYLEKIHVYFSVNGVGRKFTITPPFRYQTRARRVQRPYLGLSDEEFELLRGLCPEYTV